MFGRLPLLLLLAACHEGPQAKTLVILHTTDEHSHIVGVGPELDDYPAATTAGTGVIKGGIGRRAVVIAQERARAQAAGHDSILVSAGDNSMGTLVQAIEPATGTDFALMKTFGYDVTTLGNHEFDFGPNALVSSMTAAGGVVPTVSSNIHFSATDPGDDMLEAAYDTGHADTSKLVHQSWVLTTKSGIKVGFVGIVGVDAAKVAPVKAPVTFSIPAGGSESDDPSKVLAAIYADVQPVVDKLRNTDKVDLVVALSHSGVDTQTPSNGEDYQIAQNVSGIDVIVSGHSHSRVDVFTVKNLKTGKDVYVQQANCFGETLGRMVVSINSGSVSLVTSDTTLIDIDDTVVSDPSFNAKIDTILGTVEATPFLTTTLGRLTGSTVTDDTSKVGDLYFYPVGKTDFTVKSAPDQRDTGLLDLWADAELAAAEAVAGPTDVDIVAQGVLRADLDKGKSGTLSFADVFRAVSLGISPNGTLGYPLGRTTLIGAELKAAFEVTAGYSYTSSDNAEYYLVGGGIQITYDTSRPMFNPKGSATDPTNGRVTKMALASDHSKPDVFDRVIFDLAQGGFTGSFADLYTVSANLYVINFAYIAGVSLKDNQGNPQTPAQTIIHRGDGSEIKDWEALGGYIRSQPGMSVPARYMTASHMICSGPLCKQ
jgi:5'-nucleotidase